MKQYGNLFEKIVSVEHIFASWQEFRRGKHEKRDVTHFEHQLEENLFALRDDLMSKTYRHGSYVSFYITDPKQRHIHKAAVRDRIVHHAVFSVLNPIFEHGFIYDSYSCRLAKGTHRGVERLASLLRKTSKNNTRPCFVLKCDIKKFFQSVDHDILFSLLREKITDIDTRWLLQEIIESFSPGIPIGNLTSQLFANVYMNVLDQFVKHTLHIPHYIRYTDDFVIISHDRLSLKDFLKRIEIFLKEKLRLSLHPHKIMFGTYHAGVDFLGYVQFPHHRLLRAKTRKRIAWKVRNGVSEQALQSYLGVLSHANAHTVSEDLKNKFWLA